MAAYLMASILEAGQTTIPLAGAAPSSPWQEAAIMIVAYSSHFICTHAMGAAHHGLGLRQVGLNWAEHRRQPFTVSGDHT